MSSGIETGLVTVLYNAIEVLPDFFKSLNSQTYTRFRLYIIDNSPGPEVLEESINLAEKYQIDFRYVRNGVNNGIAGGNNQGTQMALDDGCEYVLFLNNDIHFPENTILDMVHHAKTAGEQIVAPKIYYAGTNIFWMAGGSINEKRGINHHRGIKKEDTGQFDEIEYTGFAPACFLLVHRSVFDRIGMMDENYFVYFDDTDFIYRALKDGMKICYFPPSRVYHKISKSTGGEESPFSVYYLTRNRFYFILKNFSGMSRYRSLLYTLWNRMGWYLKADTRQRNSFRRGLRDLPGMLAQLKREDSSPGDGVNLEKCTHIVNL